MELFVGGRDVISHLRELSLVQPFVYVLEEIAVDSSFPFTLRSFWSVYGKHGS